MTGEDSAGVKIAPPILLLLHLLVVWGLKRLFPWPEVMPGGLRWAGALLAAAGLALMVLAVRRMVLQRTTYHPNGSVTSLVTDFPFGFSRNPIYLGYALMLAGLSAALGTYWGAVMCLPFVLLMNLLVIRYEEAYLARKFGQAYLQYLTGVRRWL